jgi:hypothetical protein
MGPYPIVYHFTHILTSDTRVSEGILKSLEISNIKLNKQVSTRVGIIKPSLLDYSIPYNQWSGAPEYLSIRVNTPEEPIPSTSISL